MKIMYLRKYESTRNFNKNFRTLVVFYFRAKSFKMSFWYAIASYISLAAGLACGLFLIAIGRYFNWGIQTHTGLKVEKFIKQLKHSSNSSNGKRTGWCMGFGAFSYNGYNFIGYIKSHH